MRKEFLVERQGRTFCLYAGLLDLATQQGLKTIRTELIQAPTDANNRVAICAATVTVERDGVERAFSGLGDAAPNNVAPAMQTCLLRMAETRAKARALRDAVNIGMAALEELGDEDASEQQNERPAPVQRQHASQQPIAAARAVREVQQPYAAATAAMPQSPEPQQALTSPKKPVVGTRMRVLNELGETCPECHAPTGKAHADRCSLNSGRSVALMAKIESTSFENNRSVLPFGELHLNSLSPAERSEELQGEAGTREVGGGVRLA